MRYLKLLLAFTKYGFLAQLEFRASFWFAILGKTIRLVVQILFLVAIFHNVPRLGNWSFEGMLLVVATFNLLTSLGTITFHRNLVFWLPNTLRDGTFDFRLTKPISPLFHSAFRVIDSMDLLSAIPVMIVWFYALAQAQVNLLSGAGLLYLGLLVAAYLFYFSLFLIGGTMSFWTITGYGMGRFLEGFLKLAIFPPEVLGSPLGIIIKIILPIAILAVVPTQALLGLVTPATVAMFMTLALAWVALAYIFWRFGLSRYSSASA